MTERHIYAGTSAYDLDRLAALPEIAPYEEPQRSERAQPATPPSEPTRKRASKRETARRAGRYRVPVFGILGALLVGGLLLMIVLSHMQLAVISSEMVQLERQMSELQTEGTYLQRIHEDAFSSAEVDRFAREELGMVDTARGQVVFIGSGASGDVAEVLRVDEESSYGLVDYMSEFFGTLREAWSSIRGS